MKTFKVTVTKKFRDKYSGVTHKPGDELNLTEDRIRETQRSGNYVEKKAAANAASKPEKATSEIKK